MCLTNNWALVNAPMAAKSDLTDFSGKLSAYKAVVIDLRNHKHHGAYSFMCAQVKTYTSIYT